MVKKNKYNATMKSKQPESFDELLEAKNVEHSPWGEAWCEIAVEYTYWHNHPYFKSWYTIITRDNFYKHKNSLRIWNEVTK